MTVTAISMLRDEADVVVPLVEHLFAEGIDRFIVADNLSVDRTRPLLEDLARSYNIKIVDDPVLAYLQSVKVTALARMAYDEGSDWVLPVDADEVFFSPDGRTIAEALADCPAEIVVAHGFDYIAQREDDSSEGNPFVRIGHRRQQTQRMGKVAFRVHPNALVHQGNHDVERPGRKVDDVLRYAHFQYRSFDHLCRKVRNGRQAYEASTLDVKHGSHWRRLGAFNDEELTGEWTKLLDEPGLVFDPCPVRRKA